MSKPMRDIQFVNGEFYHIFNRGNNKRIIFTSQFDLGRFLQSMSEFNVKGPIGSIYANSFNNQSLSGSTTKSKIKPRLINFVCYCLNPNHFHILAQQLLDGGIMEFMHKLGTGYTRYFNERTKSSGALFQGRYKAIHVNSNDYLLHLSVYINLNDRVHKLSGSTTKLRWSSWDEYINSYRLGPLCKKSIVLDQFNSISEYKNFAKETLETIKERKDMEKSLELLLSG